MKKSILLFILVSLFTWSYAVNPVVSVNDAKQTATNFLAEQCHFNAATIQLTLQHTEMDENGEPLFYRFKLNNRGFVIVSASKYYYPVLAFSYESDYEASSENESFCADYKESIHEAKLMQAPVDVEASKAWNHYNVENFIPSRDVSTDECQPLLTSNWGQNAYYNQYCPYDGHATAARDRRTTVGSAGLAMSSIINYYRYPTQGYGGVSYISSRDWGAYQEVYPRFFLNLNEEIYDYDAMPSTITNYNGEVAKLLFHTGATALTTYSAERTTNNRTQTEPLNVLNSLKQYWGFSNDAQLNFRPTEIQDDSIWIADYIVSELKQRRPVFFSAYFELARLNNICLVIDGYKYVSLAGHTLAYLHVNYTSSVTGASEMKKAFYLYSNFTHKYNQSVIRFLQPSSLSIEKPVTSQKVITALAGTISDGAGNMKYASNSNRQWTLAAPHAHGYTLTFKRLNTDSSDVISIYSGEEANPANLIQSFSGQYLTTYCSDPSSPGFDPSMSVLPAPISVVSDKVLVTFTSNDTIEDYGFVLDYAVDAATMDDVPSCADLTVKNYHYILTDTTTMAFPNTMQSAINSIVSNNDPYKAQNVCTWTVRADSTATGLSPTRYSITFPKFELMAGDFVEITTMGTTPQLLYLFDVYNMPQNNNTYIVDENRMKIRFVSDHWKEGTGFELEYWALNNTGINQGSGLSDVRIYPNPATDYLNVNMTAEAQQVNVTVVDMSGKVLYTDVFNHGGGTQIYKVPVSELSSGIYFMNLMTPTGKTVQKFIVR